MRVIPLFFSYFIVLTVLASCSNKAEELNGEWELITAPQTGFDYFWHFAQGDKKGGNVAIYVKDTLSGEIDTCSTGDFFVKNSVITIGAPIAFCEWSTFDGEWDINLLNSKKLALIRYLPRGTIYLEFAKR